MSYIGGVLQRFMFLIVFFLITCFPGGVIIFAAVCRGKPNIDALDWIASIFVPFYGLIRSLFC